MGLTGASLNRFRDRVDDVCADAFPITLRIGDTEYADCSGPGARLASFLPDGGSDPDLRVPIRIPLAAFPQGPKIGDRMIWIVNDHEIPVEVVQVGIRPVENRWPVVVKKARV